MNPDLLIFPNYLQTEQAMSTNAELSAELARVKALIGLANRPREEENQPGSNAPKAPAPVGYRWTETKMSGYLKTGHMWNKDENGNLYGRCLHKGCDVFCGSDTIPVNCVGNNKYKVENGIVVTESKNGTGVYTRKVL